MNKAHNSYNEMLLALQDWLNINYGVFFFNEIITFKNNTNQFVKEYFVYLNPAWYKIFPVDIYDSQRVSFFCFSAKSDSYPVG